MKKLFLDTETSGIKPGQICQLTYVITVNDKVTVAKNFFLTCDYIEPGAQAVHGFSVEKLKILSDGKKFEDIAVEVAADLKDGIFIAHNAQFDIKFVKAEMERAGYKFDIEDDFCTMQYFTDIVQIENGYGQNKWPSLVETMSFLGIDPKSKSFNDGLKKLYGSDSISFHDARYDVCGLISVYYRARKLGYIL